MNISTVILNLNPSILFFLSASGTSERKLCNFTKLRYTKYSSCCYSLSTEMGQVQFYSGNEFHLIRFIRRPEVQSYAIYIVKNVVGHSRVGAIHIVY